MITSTSILMPGTPAVPAVPAGDPYLVVTQTATDPDSAATLQASVPIIVGSGPTASFSVADGSTDLSTVTETNPATLSMTFLGHPASPAAPVAPLGS